MFVRVVAAAGLEHGDRGKLCRRELNHAFCRVIGDLRQDPLCVPVLDFFVPNANLY